ncbi:hypothetical protein, partial [Paraburkholderia sp.]|uniref:hypothetical protein n=1 Tax=Paraburkholderia sp. TaxID=1926495 RepID=UPI003C78F426
MRKLMTARSRELDAAFGARVPREHRVPGEAGAYGGTTHLGALVVAASGANLHSAIEGRAACAHAGEAKVT